MSTFTGTVGITGLNATDNPGPGVAVAMALRSSPRFEGRLVALAYDALDPGLYLPGLLDAAYLIPYPSAGRGPLLERLGQVAEAEGLDVLLPNLDSELPALMGQEPVLREMGVGTLLPTRAQYDRRSKARLHELAAEGIPVPRAEVLGEVGPLYGIHERFDMPVVVKSAFYGAEVAHSTDEAVRAFHRAAATWGLPVIVQEHVEGEEVVVAAIGDGEGGVVGAVPMKKMLLTDRGKGWAGVTIRDPALLELTSRLLRVLRWRGPCEVEVRRDRAGAYHLLEINPRFPAWVDLCAMAGENLPMTAVLLAAGQTTGPLGTFEPGRAFIRVSVNHPLDLATFEALSTRGELPQERP